MRGHIADDQWIDIVEGIAGREVRAHLESCVSCRETADEVRGGWALADEADVPEPSPLYWESFRQRVGEAIAEESVPRPRARFAPVWLAAAATIVVALSWTPLKHRLTPGSTPANVPVIEAWSALPADEDDASLPVLVAMTEDEDLSPAAGCADVTSCVMELSDEESEGLAETLRAELEGQAL